MGKRLDFILREVLAYSDDELARPVDARRGARNWSIAALIGSASLFAVQHTGLLVSPLTEYENFFTGTLVASILPFAVYLECVPSYLMKRHLQPRWYRDDPDNFRSTIAHNYSWYVNCIRPCNPKAYSDLEQKLGYRGIGDPVAIH